MRVFHDLVASRGTLAGLSAIGIFWGCLVAMLPVLQPRIGLSDAGLGLVLFAAAGASILAMWLAPVLDQLLGRRSLAVAALAFAVMTPLVGWTTTVAGLALVMLGVGLTAGLLDIIANARIGDLEASIDRGLMSLNHALYSFTYAGAAILTGFAREAGLSPEAIFAVAGSGCLLAGFGVMAVRMPDGEVGSTGPGKGGVGPVVWLLGCITLVAFFAENATEMWSALHVERTLGGGATEGALGPAIMAITMGIGRLAGHVITPRGSELTVLRWGAAIAAGGLAVAAMAPTPALAYLGFGTLGLGASVMAPLALALAGQWAEPGKRTLSISRAAFVGYFGFFIGPPLLGVMSELFGLRGALGVAALLLLAVPLILLPVLVRKRAV